MRESNDAKGGMYVEETLLRIGEIAALFNVSVKAVRLYDKKGLIIPAKTDPVTGYRYYTADQVPQLRALLEFKALGFSLREIKEILQGRIDAAQLVLKLKRKRMAWLDAQALAEHKAGVLARMMKQVSADNASARSHAALTDEERAWRLINMVCVEGTYVPAEMSEALWV